MQTTPHKVLILQSWYDLALQTTGLATNSLEIAKANNRSVTDDLKVNEIVQIPTYLTQDFKTLRYYEINGIKPATGLTTEDLAWMDEATGIGKMIINNNFIVT